MACDVVVADTIRIPSDAVDPTVKNFGRLDFVNALFEAYDRDADYAVLLDDKGCVTEGRGWNIFALKGGVLTSPDRGVLEGITRKTVLELSDALNIEGRLARLPVAGLRCADEVFLSGNMMKVPPVTGFDGTVYQTGPLTRRARALYWDWAASQQ